MSEPKFRLAHILVEQKYHAEDLVKKLSQGATFSDLAQKFSMCSSAPKGGDLGVVALSRLDPDFVEAAEKLKAGEVSAPVRTRFGYHLIARLKDVAD